VILERVHLGDEVTHFRDKKRRRGVVAHVFGDRIDGWVHVQWQGESHVAAHSQAELRTTAGATPRPEEQR
jgi:hypothetical protein